MNQELSTHSLTVILPAFNEEKNLPIVASQLLKILSMRLKNFHIVIVNDGSSDHTAQVAEEIGEKNQGRISVVHLSQNSGIGAAYLKALEKIETDFVTWLPSDGEISLDGFSLMLDELNLESIIVTYPQHHLYQRNIFRQSLSKLYTLILNLSFGLNLKYYNGNSIFPTARLKKQLITSRRFAFNAEALIHVIKAEQLKYIEKPFVLNQRPHGQSKAIRLNSFLDVTRSYLYLIKLYVFSRSQ